MDADHEKMDDNELLTPSNAGSTTTEPTCTCGFKEKDNEKEVDSSVSDPTSTEFRTVLPAHPDQSFPFSRPPQNGNAEFPFNPNKGYVEPYMEPAHATFIRMFDPGAVNIPQNVPTYVPNAPGYSGNAPGSSRNIPGYLRNSPGYSQNAPGYSQNVAGFPQNVPGHSQNAPGYSQNVAGFAPNYPSYSQNVPGYSQNAAGFPQNVHGYSRNAPGYSRNAPGYSRNAPGYSRNAPQANTGPEDMLSSTYFGKPKKKSSKHRTPYATPTSSAKPSNTIFNDEQYFSLSSDDDEAFEDEPAPPKVSMDHKQKAYSRSFDNRRNCRKTCDDASQSNNIAVLKLLHEILKLLNKETCARSQSQPSIARNVPYKGDSSTTNMPAYTTDESQQDEDTLDDTAAGNITDESRMGEDEYETYTEGYKTTDSVKVEDPNVEDSNAVGKTGDVTDDPCKGIMFSQPAPGQQTVTIPMSTLQEINKLNCNIFITPNLICQPCCPNGAGQFTMMPCNATASAPNCNTGDSFEQIMEAIQMEDEDCMLQCEMDEAQIAAEECSEECAASCTQLQNPIELLTQSQSKCGDDNIDNSNITKKSAGAALTFEAIVCPDECEEGDKMDGQMLKGVKSYQRFNEFGECLCCHCRDMRAIDRAMREQSLMSIPAIKRRTQLEQQLASTKYDDGNQMDDSDDEIDDPTLRVKVVKSYQKFNEDGECMCCHCRDMRDIDRAMREHSMMEIPLLKRKTQLEQQLEQQQAAIKYDDGNQMHFFIDSLIMDLDAMEYARRHKNNTQNCGAPKPISTNNCDASPRPSFPVTITEVTDLGTTSLYVKWVIHDAMGVGGYEIYVDGYLTNRYFHCNHVAAVICDVDVTVPHKIVLLAQKQMKDELDPMADDKCKSILWKTNTTDEQKKQCSCPKSPSELWTPSVYLYDPAKKNESPPIVRCST